LKMLNNFSCQARRKRLTCIYERLQRVSRGKR
jgi:hypothetical protein